MKISTLSCPAKSHRKLVLLPPESVKLAELIGIILGDGGINNMWQVVVTVNALKDKEYIPYIRDLFQELFRIPVAERKRPRQNASVIVCSSTTVVDFLVEKGCVRGNKVDQQITISAWILQHSSYARACVRGLIDTDGCMYVHHHIVHDTVYNNIGLCFTSKSQQLILAVACVLRQHGIIPHLPSRGTDIYLYKKQAVIDYLRIFGSSNPRIFKKYESWRGARAA